MPLAISFRRFAATDIAAAMRRTSGQMQRSGLSSARPRSKGPDPKANAGPSHEQHSCPLVEGHVVRNPIHSANRAKN